MSATLSNRHRKLEKYVQVVREDGLNTDQNVNVGITPGKTPNLWVAGNLTVGGSSSGGASPLIQANAATGPTLTAAQSGSVVLFNRAAGSTVTLPAPVVGLHYRFVVLTSVTSNAYKLITDAGTTLLQGWLGVPVAAGTQKLFFADASSDVSVNLNGTTTGGLFGGEFEALCVSSTLWQVWGNVEGSGTVATPFATS
jgi:hypothetical protein